MDPHQYRRRRPLILFLIILAATGIIYGASRYEWAGWLDQVVNEKTPPVWFVSFMCLLPILGVPIFAFLILAGAKFGLAGGLLVTAVTMPVHLLVSFFMVHSVLRHRLVKLLAYLGYRLPKVPENRIVPFAVLFVAIPGLPYAVKNYALALAGIPFRHYFGISLPINVLLSVPVIGLGASAIQMDAGRLALFAAILVIGYLAVWWLRNAKGKRI